jgi:hypothetical protein
MFFINKKNYFDKSTRISKEKSFDLVHAHDWLTFKAAIKIGQLNNCPVILHVHSVESDRSANGIGNSMVQENRINSTAYG